LASETTLSTVDGGGLATGAPADLGVSAGWLPVWKQSA